MSKKINMKLCKTKSDGSIVLDKEACIDLCDKEYLVYRSDRQELFARVKRNNKIVEYDMQSTDFAREVRNFLRAKSGLNNVDNTALKRVLDYLSDKAFYSEEKKLVSRAYYDDENNKVLIDMCDGSQVVCITKDNIEMIERPVAVFQEYPTDLSQVKHVKTDAKEVPSLLKRVARLNEEDIVILATFIVACLFGNSKPIPLLFITGPQGSAKSTLSRCIQSCVDPSKSGLFSLSESKKDIAIAVSKRLLCAFDNTGGLKNKKALSDLLCSVVTKGSMQTRTLYTTKDETVIEYRSALVINGIDFLTDQTDLLERCLMIEMSAIPDKERKTEKELQSEFQSVLPQLLGGFYDIIQKILAQEEVIVSKLNRMADYELLAVQAAVAMGYTAEWFQEALCKNIQNIHRAFSMGDITVKAISMFMENRTEYTGSMSELQMACYDVLTGKVLKAEQSSFPKSDAAFSRRINGLKKQLEQIGVTFSTRVTNKYTEISLWRTDVLI